MGLSLSASLIFNYPTINALAPYLAEKMGIAMDGQAHPTVEEEKAVIQKSDELDHLDKDELEALLEEELSTIDDVLGGGGFDANS
jgi:hypothetical protein